MAILVGTADGFTRALKGETVQLGDIPFDFRIADPRYATTSGQKMIQVTFFPVLDEDQHVIQVVALNADVTEQKRAQAELLASEEKYRNLFENAHDSIFIADPVSRQILDSNKIAAERLGYTRDELLKMRIDEISPTIPTERIAGYIRS